MEANGVKALVIVNLDQASGAAIEKEAAKQGVIPVDYDRLTPGGGAAVYVSFNGVTVGQVQGKTLTQCPQVKSQKSVQYVDIDGAPTDNNALLFAQGYDSVLGKTPGWTRVAKQTGNWDGPTAGRVFSQMLNKNPNIKAVMVANDTMAQAVITDLKSQNLVGKVAVSGQDATAGGLQNIMTGSQCFTIYKPSAKEAFPAMKAVAQLVNGQQPSDVERHDDRPDHEEQGPVDPRDADRDHQGERRPADQRRLHAEEHRCAPDSTCRCARRTASSSTDQRVRRVGMGWSSHSAATTPPRYQPMTNSATKGSGMADGAILELRNINKSFGAVDVLKDVEFHAKVGEVTALVGDNGAGKSTLVKCIAGTYPIDSGDYRVRGTHRARALAARRVRSSGSRSCTRTSRCATTSTSSRTCSSAASARRGIVLDESSMEQSAEETLKSLSVRTLKSVRQRVSSLSGGQRQTVAIAKAVLWNSKVVVLDEPTAALGRRADRAGARPRPPARRPRRRRRADLAQHDRRPAGRRRDRDHVPRQVGRPGAALGRQPAAAGRADHHRIAIRRRTPGEGVSA